LIGLLSSAAAAFVLSAHRWPQPSTTVYYGLLSDPYASAFASAAGEWTSRSVFQFNAQASAIGPCSASGPLGLGNGANFGTTTCDGTGFGDSDLAVTETVYDGNTGFLLAAAITFNTAQSWSVYDGPLQASIDFRRVALHELGHFLGLEHETNVPAIMNPDISDLDRLQDDDINGAAALYVPLGAATLVAPAETLVNTARPLYQWNAAPGSSWYRFYLHGTAGTVSDSWYSASNLGCGAGSGTCSLDPGFNLQDGIYSWWIMSWNYVKAGPWSTRSDFTVAAAVVGPGATTLSAPTGTATTPRPTFTWSAVAGSTWYQLWLASPSGAISQTWYRASDAGCASGTGMCQITPSRDLSNGSWSFAVETWSPAGSGSWSAPQVFVVSTPLLTPPATTLIAPLGLITTTSPTFQWNAIATSTWYQLYLSPPSGGPVATWYRASDVGCASGTGACSVNLPSPLSSGSYRFWVQTWNSNGAGPWSAPGNFNVP
jgi:hypothetical protein